MSWHELPTSDIHKMAVEELDTSKLLTNAAKQRDERNYKDLLIIDVDCHHYENESLPEIIEYIEDPVLKHSAQMATAGGTGVQTSFLPGMVGYQDIAGRITRYPLRKTEKIPTGEIHRDVTLTLRWMDAMGVDYVCLFPTPMLAMGSHPQTEVEVNMARAYNRWLTENILYSEPRIKSMLYLPFNDPEATYKMVQDFGDKKGVVGFMVTAVRYAQVYDNAYMKTYSLLEELGKPIAFHAGYSWSDQLLSTTNRFIATHALGFTFFNVVHCANWIVNGLPVRFPKLKVIWIESGIAWVPWLMQRLDNDYKMRSSECPSNPSRPPSTSMAGPRATATSSDARSSTGWSHSSRRRRRSATRWRSSTPSWATRASSSWSATFCCKSSTPSGRITCTPWTVCGRESACAGMRRAIRSSSTSARAMRSSRR